MTCHQKERHMYGTPHATRTAIDPQPAAPSLIPVHGGPMPELERVNIGLLDEERQAIVDILNTVLADEFVLYAKTRRFHWNVEGVHFAQLHQLFEQQYEQLAQAIDGVAERARA